MWSALLDFKIKYQRAVPLRSLSHLWGNFSDKRSWRCIQRAFSRTFGCLLYFLNVTFSPFRILSILSYSSYKLVLIWSVPQWRAKAAPSTPLATLTLRGWYESYAYAYIGRPHCSLAATATRYLPSFVTSDSRSSQIPESRVLAILDEYPNVRLLETREHHGHGTIAEEVVWAKPRWTKAISYAKSIVLNAAANDRQSQIMRGPISGVGVHLYCWLSVLDGDRHIFLRSTLPVPSSPQGKRS